MGENRAGNIKIRIGKRDGKRESFMPRSRAMPREWDPQSKIWRQKQMEETNGGRWKGGPKGKKTQKVPLPSFGDNRIKHILGGAFAMWSGEREVVAMLFAKGANEVQRATHFWNTVCVLRKN